MASQELPDNESSNNEIPNTEGPNSENPDNESLPLQDMTDAVLCKEQDKYLYDGLVKLLGLVVFCGTGCAVLFGIFLLLSPIRSPAPLFFQATDAGQLMQDVPLDKPNLSLNVLLNWVTQGMMAAHTLNFMNYTTVTQNAQPYFTKDGYDSYLNTLKDSKIIDEIVTKKYVMRAFPVSAPQITKEGVLANFYLWKIRVPMQFRFRNVDTDRYDDIELTVLVVRVPSTEAPYGVKILKYDLLIKKAT